MSSSPWTGSCPTLTDPGAPPADGWAFRHGPETVAGDRFRVGSTLAEGVLPLGSATWQLFSRIWPGRDDPFSARMNAAPKLVATRIGVRNLVQSRHLPAKIQLDPDEGFALIP